MTMMMACLPGVPGDAGTRLVGPASLRGPATLTRAQVTSRASALGADGATWSEWTSDTPRFQGLARHLLIEGQRTNGVRNPGGAGAVTGSPGTLPTNWAFPIPSGLTRTIVGAGVADGIEYLDMRFAGTLGINNQPVGWAFETSTAIPASPGQVWTASVFLALVGGSLANVGAIPLNIITVQADGTTSLDNSIGSDIKGALTGTLARFQHSATPSALSAYVVPRLRTLFGAVGTAVDMTLRIGWPQMELGAFASSPTLPAVGTPAASTRGADLVTAPLASLGITGPCTVLWGGLLPQNAPSGAPQLLFEIDDGTLDNRFYVENAAGGGNIQLGRTLAGAQQTTLPAAVMTPGTPFAAGLAIQADGSASLVATGSGSTLRSVTGGPTGGLTTLRLGTLPTGTGAMFGQAGQLRVLPFALTGAQLSAATAAFG